MASDAAIRAMFDRRRQHATMYQRHPYTVACPRCGADRGQPCRRPDGERRAAHFARVCLDDPQLTLGV